MESEKRRKGAHGTPAGYVNMAELCQLFGRSRKTIHRMVETGALPRPLKFGRQNIWEQKEIETWLKHAKFAKKAKVRD
jgi:predicted DNA-binding transcriptional regulator AlpA